MRILIHSYFYHPEPIWMPHELAVSLARRGHDVQVVTGFPSYPQGKLYDGYRQRPWKRETIDGIPVLRLPLMVDHSRSSLRRILSYGSFMASSCVMGTLGIRPADVMYVWHPPLSVGVSAWTMGMMRRIPFVYAVNDLWPEAILATGMVRSKKIISGLRWLERFVYNRAKAIITISPGYRDNLIGKGVPPEKVTVMTNWANEEIYQPVEPDPALASELGMAGRFNVVFGGNMGLAQNLETVVETADLLKSREDIQFLFAGDGVARYALEGMVQERKLDNVRFLGQQPATRMPPIYALSDVLLAHYKRDPLFEISIPAKIFSYMACQRPVLMASAGNAADLVEAAGAGTSCPAEDPQAMAKAVLDLHSMSAEERAVMGTAGRQAFLENHSREVLVRRHEELLMQVANMSPSLMGGD